MISFDPEVRFDVLFTTQDGASEYLRATSC